MKKFVFLFFLFLLLTGMGGLGVDGENKLPKVTEKYAISLTDMEGYTTKLTEVSLNDNVYISGFVGKGKHVIGFNEIKKIVISPLNEKDVEVKIYFKDGNANTIITNGKSTLKGKSKYGVFIINLKDIKEITFLGKE